MREDARDPEPDGRRLCVTHSDTLRARDARRRAAEAGRLRGASSSRRVQGTTGGRGSPRRPPSSAREEPDDPVSEEDNPVALGGEWPEALNLESVTGSGGQMEWRQALLRNFAAGHINTEEARVMSQLIREASAMKPPTPSDADKGDQDTVEGALLELNERLKGRDPDEVLLASEGRIEPSPPSGDS